MRTTLTHKLIGWLHTVALGAADAAMVVLAFRLAAKLQRIRDTRTAPEGTCRPRPSRSNW